MIPVLLIVIPLVSGLIAFLLKQERAVKAWALLSAIATLAVSLLGLTVMKQESWLQFNKPWLPYLGSNFHVGMDGMAQVLCLLTAVTFPIIFISTWNNSYRKAHNFFALMLLAQAGLMGVFVALDALLFYFFWELALIPVYFLSSQWGGERRIAATFKFFIYTFLGSLFMLIGIIYIYQLTPGKSFDIHSFYNVNIHPEKQDWLFWLMLVAFAIKMPIFPFHTWQPDTYEQSNTATTMVLSAVMVKMGVFGILRWLTPVVPHAVYVHGDTTGTFIVIGIVYASLVAMQQDDLKRLVAYSSIAHLGLMALAIFVPSNTGVHGVLIQMFNHGINILGLWIVVELIERQLGTRKMSELGGLAQKAPSLAVLLVVVALANVALPLTNAFIGEFMMFAGIFTSEASPRYHYAFAAVGMIAIILSAVYTLNMIQKVFYGNTSALTANARDIRINEKLVLSAIVVMIIAIGVYPAPLLEMTKGAVDAIVSKMILKQP
jgi:proton-translocating NADH-quinone oxidoreductase, chain M